MSYAYFSIDATKEEERIERFINHSRRSPNAVPKVEGDRNKGKPHAYFRAVTDIIAEGIEIVIAIADLHGLRNE